MILTSYIRPTATETIEANVTNVQDVTTAIASQVRNGYELVGYTVSNRVSGVRLVGQIRSTVREQITAEADNYREAVTKLRDQVPDGYLLSGIVCQ